MKTSSVSCEEFREGLDALLAEALDPGPAQELLAHKESCEGCGEAFEVARALLSALAALPSPLPSPRVIENLERSIELDRQGVAINTLWTRLRTHSMYRLVAAMALGLLAAFVSTFSFSQVALSLEGLSRTLLVCAIFWACGYTGMFDLAFRDSIDLRARRGFNLMRAAERLALPVLLALGAATLGLLAISPFGGLRLIFPEPTDVFASPGARAVPYSGWFLLGAVVGAVSLLLGSQLGRVRAGRALLLDGMVAGSLFAVMIAPGFAVICVPFTIGLFITLSAGLVIGALAGGVFGFWSLRFLRTRLWEI